MNITRRSAFIGASAAFVAAGTPAAVNAAARGNPDAALFALVDELERVERKRMETQIAENMERKAIQDRLPMPPVSIRLGDERSIMGRDGVMRWQTVSARFVESTRAEWIRERPERSKQINTSFDRIIEERRAYEAEVDRLRNGPKVRELQALRDEIICRSDELATEIRATPAGTVAGVLRKLQAADLWGHFEDTTRTHVSAATPRMIASAMRDLERLAGGKRS